MTLFERTPALILGLGLGSLTACGGLVKDGGRDQGDDSGSPSWTDLDPPDGDLTGEEGSTWGCTRCLLVQSYIALEEAQEQGVPADFVGLSLLLFDDLPQVESIPVSKRGSTVTHAGWANGQDWFGYIVQSSDGTAFVRGAILGDEIEQESFELPHVSAEGQWTWSALPGHEAVVLVYWDEGSMTSTYFVLSLSDELKGEVLVLAAAPARVLGYLPGDRGVILEQPLSDQAGRCLLSRYHPEGGAQLDPLSKVGCGTTMRTSAAYHDALVLIEPVDSESGGSTVSIVDTNSFELLQRFGPIRGAGVQFSPKDSRFALRHGIEVWSGDFGWTEGHLLFGDLQTLWSYDPLWEEGAPYNEIGGGNFYIEAFTEDGAIISYDGNYYQKAFSAGPWAPLVLPQGASIFSDGYEWGYTTSSQLHWRGRTYDLPEGQLWDNPEPYHDGLWLAAYTERFEEGERQLHYVIEDGREPMLLSDLPDRDGGYRLFALQDGGGIAHRTQGKIYFVDENLDLHLLADGQSVVR